MPKAFDASRAVPEVMDTVGSIRSGIVETVAEWRSMPKNKGFRCKWSIFIAEIFCVGNHKSTFALLNMIWRAFGEDLAGKELLVWKRKK